MESKKTFRIKFLVDVPPHVALGEVEEWVRFNLHDNGYLSGKNPLVDNELVPVRWSVEVEEK